MLSFFPFNDGEEMSEDDDFCFYTVEQFNQIIDSSRMLKGLYPIADKGYMLAHKALCDCGVGGEYLKQVLNVSKDLWYIGLYFYCFSTDFSMGDLSIMLTLEQYTKIKKEASEIEKKILILQDRREKAEETLKLKYNVEIENAKWLLEDVTTELAGVEAELLHKYKECLALEAV